MRVVPFTQGSIIIAFVSSENAESSKQTTKKESKNEHQSINWNVNYIYSHCLKTVDVNFGVTAVQIFCSQSKG
jgi:hypothetical protein